MCLCFSAYGGYSRVDGNWSPERYAPEYSVAEHFDYGSQALEKQNWQEAHTHFMTICYHFKDSPFYADAVYFCGVENFEKGELDEANVQFNTYLQLPGRLKHFESVFSHKYEIAEAYRTGKKKHIFGVRQMPRLFPGGGDALVIYDEILAALPGKELSAKALFGKGKLLFKRKDYRESIEALQTLSRRFPRHSLSAEGYLVIGEVYLKQSDLEAQNPDLIALAGVNLNKFKQAFPGDSRHALAAANVSQMRENYAMSLYQTGRFYERKKKPNASEIYYQDTIRKFSETEAAHKSQERLSSMGLSAAQALAMS
ncbi:MAG: Outer membrane protein assembly factor BamD [Chlamydiae bacterium]|nr:Outer membrane protein assembly factor BamD [Chlamydiota bacterium]